MSRIFQTTSPRGLNHSLPPMRLWQKAKRLGVWNPAEIDFSQDRRDWLQLNDDEKRLILHLTTLFQAGEEAVTLDLLPLIMVIAEEGRLEEEIYLTSFLYEEAKHVEAFRRFFDEVAEDSSDLSHFHTENYRYIFYQALPEALHRLKTDPSPITQAEASVTYNMIVEGVLAETGYQAYFTMLKQNKIMPGMVQVTEYLKRDESRHLAYGVYLLSRLVAEHGEPVWASIEQHMGNLFVPAIEVVNETFAAFDDQPPFGLEKDAFVTYAIKQFQARMSRIERAREQTLDEINRAGDYEIEG